MRILFGATGMGIALAVTGCADRFRPAAPDHAHAVRAAQGAPDRLLVAALPADLTWLAESLALYREIGRTAAPSDDTAAPPAADGMSVLPSSPTPAAAAPLSTGSPQETAEPSATADVHFISLPPAGDAAQGLAPVPAELEAAVAPAMAPPALQAARAGSRTIALPVAARWLALAYDPAHLEESPSPVPPNLEAWMEQLRALHRRRPEHPPLIVAWDENRIADSFALLLAAEGGRLLDEAGHPAFSGSEGVAAIEHMSRMLAEGLVQPTALSTDSHRLAAAMSGPYAYWLCSSDAIADREGPRPERLAALRLSGLPIAAAHYQYPDAASVALVQFRGVAVAGGSPHAAAAWRLARFLADPVVLRSAPPAATVLTNPPAAPSAFVRQARALIAREALAAWPDVPGMNEVLGRFLHAALRRTLAPREALERAAFQIAHPGALPAPADERPGAPGTPRTGGPPTQEAGPSSPSNAGPGSNDSRPGEPSRSTGIAPSAPTPASP